MTLTSENVELVLKDTLYSDGENTDNAVFVEGIVGEYGFNPDKLNLYKDNIISMLSELPEEFNEKIGGGWSFVNACVDRNGTQWTSFHQSMEQLFCLGMAIDKVKCLMPREMWQLMPGGMPYYVILE